MSEKIKYWGPTNKVLNMKTDDLVGKKFVFTRDNGEERVAIVAGADPMIGISIVFERDTKDIVYCLHGPLDPSFRKDYLTNTYFQESYNKKFPFMVECIRQMIEIGRGSNDFMYDFQEMNDLVLNGNGNSACPYGI